MRYGIGLGLLAVFFFSTGCEDYLRWLRGGEEPICEVVYDCRTGDEYEDCWYEGEDRPLPTRARRGVDCGHGDPPNFGCACDDVFEPVCDAHGRQYSNRCTARCATEEPVGPCDDAPGRPGGGDCNCTREWSPVCDAAGNVYGNRCAARCAGAGPVTPCDGNEPPPSGGGGSGGDPGDCPCPAIRAPVCGADGTRYSNRCVARCADAGPVTPCGDDEPPSSGQGGSSGDATRGGCDCPLIWLPVCDDDGTRYPNDCVAACAGAIDVEPC